MLKPEPKVVGIYSDKDELIRSVQRQSFLLSRQLQAFTLFDSEIGNSLRALSKQSAAFLWSQLLFDVLIQLPQTETAKSDMIEQCSAYYESNESQLAKINEFQNTYERGKAIEWFTMDSFIYRLINRAIRTEDMQVIYLFRFFIIDLCWELEAERKAMIATERDTFTVYRGQQIPAREFQTMQNNVGQLISTNGFFSTSKDMNTALAFILGATNSHILTTVMFAITVPAGNLKSVIFADIARLSRMPSEQEVLFSLGAVFRIDKVEGDSVSGVGKVYLTVTDEGVTTIEEYKQWISGQIIDNSSEILFGCLLNMSGKRKQAEVYFHMLLKKLPGKIKNL